MGSLFSKFKTNAIPVEHEEYSDDEDVIVLTKFKKSDFPMPMSSMISSIDTHDYDQRFGSGTAFIKSGSTMTATTTTTTTRPVPQLIPAQKFSRVPDLQKCYKPASQLYGSNSRKSRLLNGFQHEPSNNKSSLVNGIGAVPFKPNVNGNFSTSSSNVASYLQSTNSHRRGSLSSLSGNNTAFSLKPHKSAAEAEHYDQLFKVLLPDFKAKPPFNPISSRPALNYNHVSSPKVFPRKSDIQRISDQDISRRTEDTIRKFSESSIGSEYKVTPVNTMRLKNESEPVFQQSFPNNLVEEYYNSKKERFEQIHQHQEQTKELSRSLKEIQRSYEHRMSQWHVPDCIVLDEDVEPEINDFPELTDEQKSCIKQAVNKDANYHTTLVSKFNIVIKRSDILTLHWAPLEWLNDEVINFYMNLLTERGELRANEGYPKVYAMNTFFTQRLCTGGHAAVRRWTKRVDLFACDIIPVPVHVDRSHWCMAIINMKNRTIKYYDSMHRNSKRHHNDRVLDALKDYLRAESLDKRNIEIDLSDWSIEDVADSPQQNNGSDCGVFSCMTAEFLCRNRPLVFSQQHMVYFRKKMALEICTGRLIL